MYDGNAWLIDMEGRVVHNWKMENPPGVYGNLSQWKPDVDGPGT